MMRGIGEMVGIVGIFVKGGLWLATVPEAMRALDVLFAWAL